MDDLRPNPCLPRAFLQTAMFSGRDSSSLTALDRQEASSRSLSYSFSCSSIVPTLLLLRMRTSVAHSLLSPIESRTPSGFCFLVIAIRFIPPLQGVLVYQIACLWYEKLYFRESVFLGAQVFPSSHVFCDCYPLPYCWSACLSVSKVGCRIGEAVIATCRDSRLFSFTFFARGHRVGLVLGGPKHSTRVFCLRLFPLSLRDRTSADELFSLSLTAFSFSLSLFLLNGYP